MLPFNKTLFNQLQARFKELGLGRLYKGSKRKARRHYHYLRCQNMLRWLDIESGSLVHDCDGFNHIVKEPAELFIYRRKNLIAYEFESTCTFEDSRFSCGCSPPTEATSAEDIRAFFRDYYEHYMNTDWVDSDPESSWQQYTKGNNPDICDENGFSCDLIRQLKDIQ